MGDVGVFSKNSDACFHKDKITATRNTIVNMISTHSVSMKIISIKKHNGKHMLIISFSVNISSSILLRPFTNCSKFVFRIVGKAKVAILIQKEKQSHSVKKGGNQTPIALINIIHKKYLIFILIFSILFIILLIQIC